MKKTVIVSAIITATLFVLNFLTGYFGNAPLVAYHGTGGEYESWFGFGILKERFSPLVRAGDEYKGHTELSFDPLSLIISFVLVLVIAFIVRAIFINNKKKHHKEK